MRNGVLQHTGHRSDHLAICYARDHHEVHHEEMRFSCGRSGLHLTAIGALALVPRRQTGAEWQEPDKLTLVATVFSIIIRHDGRSKERGWKVEGSKEVTDGGKNNGRQRQRERPAGNEGKKIQRQAIRILK